MEFKLPNGEEIETWEVKLGNSSTFGIEYKGEHFGFHCRSEEQAVTLGLCAQWMAKILHEEQKCSATKQTTD